jgi:hypothetical protein
VKNTALTTLYKLAVLPHLTIPTNLVDRKTTYYPQTSHLVRPHQSFCLYTNARIGNLKNNFRTLTKRLNFLWFLNLVFFVVFLSFFLILALLTSPSLFSYHYSDSLHFPSCPPPACHHTTPPSYTLTTVTSLLYRLYTSPAPCNPWRKHPPWQQKYWDTQRLHNPAAHITLPPLTHPFPAPPLRIPQNL